MKEKLIKNYVNNITVNDIKEFALKNNINITNDEANYLLKLIKREWYQIVFGNPDKVLLELKNHFSPDKYQQLYQLYQMYKNKYSHYL